MEFVFMIFLDGMTIGFAIAAPVGPIGLLCINRTLTNGLKIGILSGLGAAFADSLYGLIAGLSLTTISAFLLKEQTIIQILGGIFLIYLGCKTFIKSVVVNSNTDDFKIPPFNAFGTTFILTLTNPMTILSFIAIFAGLGVGTESKNYASALLLVSGIFLGSTLWWLIISFLSNFFRKSILNNNLLKVINMISGAIILAFGLFSFRFLL